MPFIVVRSRSVAPTPRAAPSTHRFVEAIDVVPTVLAALGTAPTHLSKAARCCRCCAAARSDLARRRVLRARLLLPRGAAAAEAAASARVPRHDGAHRPLEIHLVAGLPAACCSTSPTTRASGAISAPLAPTPISAATWPTASRPGSGAQDAGHGRRRLCRGAHRHAQEARDFLRGVVNYFRSARFRAKLRRAEIDLGGAPAPR